MTYITGARDDLSPEEFTDQGRAQKVEPVRRLTRRAKSMRSFDDMASPPLGKTFADDLVLLLTRLKEAGIEQVLAVDLTKPEFDVPVVKVVIPGLEDADDHDGYLPGPRAKAMEAGA